MTNPSNNSTETHKNAFNEDNNNISPKSKRSKHKPVNKIIYSCEIN